jgi:hypothetical protein
LASLDVSYQSHYGEIRSSWTIKGTDVSWLVTIPPNATARLPLTAAQQGSFTLDGQALSGNKKLRQVSSTIYELPAGTYTFKVTTTH